MFTHAHTCLRMHVYAHAFASFKKHAFVKLILFYGLNDIRRKKQQERLNS